jgi:hypothetical protein
MNQFEHCMDLEEAKLSVFWYIETDSIPVLRLQTRGEAPPGHFVQEHIFPYVL